MNYQGKFICDPGVLNHRVPLVNCLFLQSVVRTSDVRVSNRVNKASVTLKRYPTVYNDLTGEVRVQKKLVVKNVVTVRMPPIPSASTLCPLARHFTLQIPRFSQVLNLWGVENYPILGVAVTQVS